jgi:hypothetical protein
MNDKANTSLWKRIVDELGRDTAYLLIFAVVALFVLPGTGFTIRGITTGDHWTMGLGALMYAIALAAAITVIWRVEARRPSGSVQIAPERPVHVPSDVSTLQNEGLREHFDGILKSIAKAVKVGSPVLTWAILERSKEWGDLAADWENGQYKATTDYNAILTKLYADARNSVFATSDAVTGGGSYTTVWKRELGERLLEAHEKGNAQVTRVFLFNDRSEVTEDVLEIMRRQAKIGKLRVLAYFDEEDEGFKFSPDVTRDFTIVDDGDAIGTTEGVSAGQATARWYFRNRNKIANFLQLKQRLEAGSIPLAQLEDWWKTKNAESAN